MIFFFEKKNRVNIRYFQQMQEHLVVVCRIDKHFGPQPVYLNYRVIFSWNKINLESAR